MFEIDGTSEERCVSGRCVGLVECDFEESYDVEGMEERKWLIIDFGEC